MEPLVKMPGFQQYVRRGVNRLFCLNMQGKATLEIHSMYDDIREGKDTPRDCLLMHPDPQTHMRTHL